MARVTSTASLPIFIVLARITSKLRWDQVLDPPLAAAPVRRTATKLPVCVHLPAAACLLSLPIHCLSLS